MDEGRVVADVRLAWCGDAIAVRRFGGGEVARIGDGPQCFAYVPCDAPGGWPVVRVDGAVARVVVPPRGKGRVDRATGAVEELAAMVAATLRPGDRARVTIGDFQLEVSATYGEAVPAKRRVIAFAPLAHVAIAALIHGGALGFAARAAASEGEEVESARANEISKVLMRAEERGHAHEDDVEDMAGKGAGALIDYQAGDGRELGGTRAAGVEGKIGAKVAPAKARARFAVAIDGSKNEAALAKDESKDDQHSFAFLGQLAASAAAPSNAWSEALLANGPDAFAARGNMRGFDSGAAPGAGGLGLSGIGEGGGGRGEGVGLGNAGRVGHGDGEAGPGAGGEGSPGMMSIGGWWGGSRCGSSCSIGSIGRIGRAPKVRLESEAERDGRLPRDIVQAIVRRNFGRFRACYEPALKTNPTLAGGVRTRFVVEGDRVVSAEDAGSTMPDTKVRDCVVKAFVGIEFPKVTHVSVVYPIAFSGVD